ncbi:OmpA family protein [Flavobacterium psychrophilum]|uniref:OmpA family protein n=1 Tax=Flavobacterium psychrophilum TaxID=96345 RepID=UPI001069D6AD|nr:OmpA family protein [Flavobacterium psychrophilum]
MKKINILLLLIIFSSSIFKVQSQSKKYSEKKYYDIIKKYSKIKTDKLSPIDKKELGFSYYNNNEFKKALPFLENIENPIKDEDLYFKLNHCYKANNEELKGNELLEKYYNLKQIDNDIFFKDISVLKSIGNRFIIKKTNKINTDFSEIFNSEDSTDVYFSSNKKKNSIQEKKYNWNNQYYYNQYKISKKDSIISSINELNTNYHDSNLVLSKDKTIGFITSNIGDEDIYLHKKENVQLYIFKLIFKNGKIKNKELLPFNSSDYSCKNPFYDEKTGLLYFSSNMNKEKGYDIYSYDIKNSNSLKNIVEINTINDEDNFYIDSNNNIYFTSNGYVGFGGKDIFTRLYDLEKKEYKRVMNVGMPVNSCYDDFGYRNIDKKGFFTSNRAGVIGNDDVYSFLETKPLELDKIIQKIKGVVINEKTNKSISNATLVLQDEHLKEIKIKTDNEGKYNFEVLGNKSYQLKIYAETYKDTTLTFKTGLIEYDEIAKDISLKSSICKQLFKGKVSEDKNYKPILNAQIQIIDVNTKKVLNTISTDKNGEYLFYVGCEKNIFIKIQFETDTEPYYAEYNEYITTDKDYNKEIQKDFILKQVSSKGLISDKNGNILIPTKPIYFNYNSAEIGEISYSELDKVSNIIKEHTSWNLIIESHSDIRGSDSYNLTLSIKRAEATKNYLIKKGIEKQRIKALGFGESKPIIYCIDKECSEEEHGVNRRSEFIIK